MISLRREGAAAAADWRWRERARRKEHSSEKERKSKMCACFTTQQFWNGSHSTGMTTAECLGTVRLATTCQLSLSGRYMTTVESALRLSAPPTIANVLSKGTLAA